MKFLTGQTLPKLTITRHSRKAVFNHVRNISTFTETTTRIEITLPSFVRGLKEKFTQFSEALTNLFSSTFLPRVYAL